MQTIKRPALGKGLSALIPDAPDLPRPSPNEADIDQLSPNDFQPRLAVDDVRLEELAQSIRSNGVIQPIVVRRHGDRFQIIAGERRWRAAKRAGLMRVPIVVKDIAAGHEHALLEMALIENLQREDLNPIDQALAYRRLADEFSLTQDAIAAAVGKDRASVANTVRLLRLPHDVRELVSAGRLSMGHARALLSVADESEQRRIGQEIVARNLSVRQAETLVKHIVESGVDAKPRRPSQSGDVHTRAAEDQLKLLFGTRVRIVRRGKKGRIEIEFNNEDELIRIFELMTER